MSTELHDEMQHLRETIEETPAGPRRVHLEGLARRIEQAAELSNQNSQVAACFVMFSDGAQ